MSLERLNRIRENAGQKPLASWKASKASLDAKIDELLAAGGSDALPGANINVAPVTDDPKVKEALEKTDEKPADGDPEIPSLADSHLSKTIDNTPSTPAAPEVKKGRAQLARGLDTDQMARQSRVAVQMAREKEKKVKKADSEAAPKKLSKKERKKLKQQRKAAQLSELDKNAIKEEAAARTPGKIAGEVDATKEPEKAKRQKDKIKEKQEKRAAEKEKPKKDKGNSNECTVAGIAKDIGMDAKVARAKLRRHEAKLTPLHTKGQDRWTFPSSAYDTIRDILKPKK